MKLLKLMKIIHQVFQAQNVIKMIRFLTSIILMSFLNVLSVSAQEDVIGQTISRTIVSPLSKTITRTYRKLTSETCKPMIFSMKFIVNDQFICDSVAFSKNTNNLLADSVKRKIKQMKIDWKSILKDNPLSSKERNYNLLLPILINRGECRGASTTLTEYLNAFEGIFMSDRITLSEVIIISPLTIVTSH